jgi:hypothetical protein
MQQVGAFWGPPLLSCSNHKCDMFLGSYWSHLELYRGVVMFVALGKFIRYMSEAMKGRESLSPGINSELWSHEQVITRPSCHALRTMGCGCHVSV